MQSVCAENAIKSQPINQQPLRKFSSFGP